MDRTGYLDIRRMNMDATNWSDELTRLASNGNDVVLENVEAKEIAALLSEGGDDGGEGANGEQ